MGTLRIEFYAGKTRVDAETRDPLGGQTLAVTSTITALGSRPVVPLGALAGGTLVELEAIDAAIYVDLGPAPDPTTSPAFLILPGQPHRVLASPGDFISAILASDIVLPSSGGGGGPATIADGADITQGAKADAAATSSTASWSVVALLKGLYAALTGILTVVGQSAVTGGSFARSANATAYASGQLVANNTVAASVAPIACSVARVNGGTDVIVGARLSKTGTSVTNASFRVHLFRTSPTVTVGDGGTLAGGVNGVTAIEIGYVDVTMDQAYSDGAKGFAALSNKVFAAASGSQNIYALLEARAAYTPVSGETFTVELEALRD